MLLVNEHSSADYVATLRDHAGVVIPGATFSIAQLTLVDEATDAIINGRAAVDVRAMISVGGVLTFPLTPDDNPFLGRERDFRQRERHIVLLYLVWPTGHHHHDGVILVRSMGSRVPEP